MAQREFKRILSTDPIWISAGTDLNDCTETGLYYIGATQTNLINSPTGYAMMLVFKSSSMIVQLIIRGATSTHGLYYRDYSGSPRSWSPWNHIQGTEVT